MPNSVSIRDFIRMCANQPDCQNCRMLDLFLKNIKEGEFRPIDEKFCHKMLMKHPDIYEMEIQAYINEQTAKTMTEKEKEDAMSIDVSIAHRDDAKKVISFLAGKLGTDDVLELAQNIDADVERAEVTTAEIIKANGLS